MSNSEKWSDLAARLGSAVAMVLVGAIGIWLGGPVFHALVALICGVMVWELVCMTHGAAGDSTAKLLAAVTGVAIFAAIYLPLGFALPLMLAPAVLGGALLERNRVIYMAFAVVIMLAGYGMMQVRDDMGVGWMLWLVIVVVATDVVGYFAGRAFGGPKFWPKVSPKKTWSGTAAGWVGAALVGLFFSLNTDASLLLIGVSILMSMASQMGDIAESALKRKMGVKDSSHLIPGHGGLLDRFDGMLGAALFLLLIVQVIDFSPVAG